MVARIGLKSIMRKKISPQMKKIQTTQRAAVIHLREEPLFTIPMSSDEGDISLYDTNVRDIYMAGFALFVRSPHR